MFLIQTVDEIFTNNIQPVSGCGLWSLINLQFHWRSLTFNPYGLTTATLLINGLFHNSEGV